MRTSWRLILHIESGSMAVCTRVKSMNVLKHPGPKRISSFSKSSYYFYSSGPFRGIVPLSRKDPVGACFGNTALSLCDWKLRQGWNIHLEGVCCALMALCSSLSIHIPVVGPQGCKQQEGRKVIGTPPRTCWPDLTCLVWLVDDDVEWQGPG